MTEQQQQQEPTDDGQMMDKMKQALFEKLNVSSYEEMRSQYGGLNDWFETSTPKSQESHEHTKDDGKSSVAT